MSSVDPKVVPLATKPSDAELAKSFKEALRPVLEQACLLQGQAMAAGMRLEWNLGLDMYGRHSIQALNVVKVL